MVNGSFHSSFGGGSNPNPVFYAEAVQSARMIQTFLGGQEGQQLAQASRAGLDDILNPANAQALHHSNLVNLAENIDLPMRGSFAVADMGPAGTAPGGPAQTPNLKHGADIGLG